MTAVIKLATLNINAITNSTRVGMLTEYIRRHDLDIVFLQEITDLELLPMPGYDIYDNIGSDIRGTDIVARNDIMLRNINKLPSGRAIAAECKGLYIVNIYAPSGTAKRTASENFYNTEVPQLLQTGHGEIIIGGDFNCVLNPADTCGHFHTSRVLAETIRELHLTDTWK
jgi:exonuclease III